MIKGTPLPDPLKIKISDLNTDNQKGIIVDIFQIQNLMHEDSPVFGNRHTLETYTLKQYIVLPYITRAEKKDFPPYKKSSISNELIVKREDGESKYYLIDPDGIWHQVNARFT